MCHDLRFWHQMRDLNSALKRRHNTRRQKCNARVCWRNFATQVFNGPMDIYLFLVQIHNTLCSSQILVWINMIYVLFIEVISILIGKESSRSEHIVLYIDWDYTICRMQIGDFRPVVIPRSFVDFRSSLKMPNIGNSMTHRQTCRYTPSVLQSKWSASRCQVGLAPRG